MRNHARQSHHAFALTLGALIAGSGILRPIAAECIAIDPNRQAEASCEMVIEFSTPTDWLCTHADKDCTVCRNLSDRASELRLRCVGDETPERQLVPPGAELSICPGDGRRTHRTTVPRAGLARLD